jgi:hypothetical protein
MWNGMLVRKDFWEPRHPQDFLPTIKDGSRPVDVRLDQADPDLDNCNVYYDYLADYEEMFSYDCPPNFNVNMII